VVSKRAFRSYARGGEDIIVWRALGSVAEGRYVDAGASNPVTGSVTAALAEHGWKGIEIPADAVLEGRLGDVLAEHSVADGDVQVLALDAAGQEATALAGLNLAHVRPTVLLIRAALPRAGQPSTPPWQRAVLDAGYRLRLFTGLFRIYVANEHDESIGDMLSYPACPLDDAARAEADPAHDLLARAENDAIRWRAVALAKWDELAAASGGTSAAALHQELDAMRNTVSWRVTRPLRAARQLLPPARTRRLAAVLRGRR
jgi:hypothetical protein